MTKTLDGKDRTDFLLALIERDKREFGEPSDVAYEATLWAYQDDDLELLRGYLECRTLTHTYGDVQHAFALLRHHAQPGEKMLRLTVKNLDGYHLATETLKNANFTVEITNKQQADLRYAALLHPDEAEDMLRVVIERGIADPEEAVALAKELRNNGTALNEGTL